VNTKCRFFAAVDPKDPNSHWRNGARVICLPSYVKSVRVEGTLDPARNDCVDWWTLVYFHRSKVAMHFPETPGLRHEVFQVTQDLARLRVVASGKQAASYAFELRPREGGSGIQSVVIHESPSMVDVKFPF
jgi:hypothetical protein